MKHVGVCDSVDLECLPVRAGLKVLRKSDPDFGLSDDEVQDRYEFIRCYLLSEHESIVMVTKPEPATDFWPYDFDEFGNDVSVFNTMDFHRLYADSFDKYAYRVKKIMERVKDLAIMHSSISSAEGRENTRKRFEDLVQNEFGDKLLGLVRQYRQARCVQRRFELKKKVAVINRKILECKEIWERYAPPESWDVES